MIDTIIEKSKSNIKDKKLKKELYFLFLAQSFGQLYLEESKIQSDKIEYFVSVELRKKIQLFKNHFVFLIEDSFDIFNHIEEKEYKKRNKPLKNRFQKRLIFEDRNIAVQGLLFCVSLILEHKNIKNKKLHLPYAKAQEIYNDFDNKNDVMCRNARVLSSLFRVYLEL